MHILIVGTGAMGCLFAARLAEVGIKVSILGSWPEGLQALRKDGVRLRDLKGNTRNFPIEVLDIAEIKRSFTEALVLVKSWQTERAALQLTQLLSAEGMALTLQNGFGNDETLKKALGPMRVALGVTTVGAKMLEPGYVQHSGEGKVMMGLYPKLDRLAGWMTQAGFQVEMIEDPRSLLWGKLIINAAINPLTALERIPNGELLKRQALRELMAEAALEAAKVARQQGIELPYDSPVEMVEEVARNTAANTSSMLQDVLRGTPTEIEAINGAIVRIGESVGIATPVNKVLWQLVQGLDHH